ncbi:MAG TPA: prolyl oligopeptidase family serine peptidase, partial [Armatimonadota bacterium]|nr:prolyl oligopeptidase family serine peptidase [Armatimonadota bacterium]
ATELGARYSHGQTFLTWREPADLAGLRFQVLIHDEPITEANASEAEVANHHITPASATDWWAHPETYGKPMKPDEDGNKPEVKPIGWVIEEGGERLDPQSGLSVHTVTPASEGARYFAVVAVDEATGERADTVEPGANSLTAPVEQSVAPIEPIWQGDPAAKPEPGAGDGLPLDLTLHAKTGRGGMEWLAFGDADLAWSDGLPFKFGADARDDAVSVRPTDRTWIGRMFPEGRDSCQHLTRSIHTFWFGYSDHIYDPNLMAEGKCVNYSERRLLWILAWVMERFETDRNRTYSTGGSMGGCGTMSFSFRHPEIFAAVAPNVPIVTYGKGPVGDSSFRVEAYTGALDSPYGDGTIHDQLNAARFAQQADVDLPFLVISVGRKDGSIPWGKNPPFFRAMQAARQGMVAAWSEGTHGEVAKLLPDDVRRQTSFAWMHRFALNESYLAFSNCSADDDPGEGPADSGDPVGFMGRGLDFEILADDEERYEARATWTLEPESLPVTVDVTPRRVQGMEWSPGDQVAAKIIDQATGDTLSDASVQVSENGLLTLEGVQVRSADGTRIIVTRTR